MSEATKLDPGGSAGSLAYRTAEKQLAAFVAESHFLAAGHGPVHPADCEAILQLGLDAFQWLMRADRTYRMAMFRAEMEYSPDLEKSLHQDCLAWLEQASATLRELQSDRARNLQLDNREGFVRQIEEMTAIVAAYQADDTQEELPPQMAPLRDAAIAEQKNGQATEFI
jgi:hypothetical protein